MAIRHSGWEPMDEVEHNIEKILIKLGIIGIIGILIGILIVLLFPSIIYEELFWIIVVIPISIVILFTGLWIYSRFFENQDLH
ncbi:MAG TPA: hypothetical protein VIS27_04685 [Yeosuana sp.]